MDYRNEQTYKPVWHFIHMQMDLARIYSFIQVACCLFLFTFVNVM